MFDGGARDPDINAYEPAGPDLDRADSRARLQGWMDECAASRIGVTNSRIGVAQCAMVTDGSSCSPLS